MMKLVGKAHLEQVDWHAVAAIICLLYTSDAADE